MYIHYSSLPYIGHFHDLYFFQGIVVWLLGQQLIYISAGKKNHLITYMSTSPMFTICYTQQ